MRAWAVVENGQPLQEMDLPTPTPTGAQVLLEVTHAGVCHSDLHIWEGEYNMGSRGVMRMVDRAMKLPLAMGHEIVGRVVAWGPEAEGHVQAGDHRIVFPWVGCGVCEHCLNDEENMCANGRALGVYQHGGYATHVLATHWKHLVAFDGLDPSLAATYACSGITVFSAIRKVMPIKASEPIVIVGAGGLGLQAVAVLRALDHQRIIVVDVSEEKLAAARAQGATDTVLATDEGTTKRIIAAAGGAVAAVIDLVNGTQTARFAFDALRKGGKLVQVGLFGGELALPLPLMAMRALTVQGSYVGSVKELRELVRIAQSRGLPPIPVTNEPLHMADAALNRLRHGQVTGRIVLTAA